MNRKTPPGSHAGHAGHAGIEAQALHDLLTEVLNTFFHLRAVGQESGMVNAQGGSHWGLMRLLADGGPQTVPQLARQRHVARQYIQRIANELEEQGLVEFAANPAHKRSKLVRLTTAGRAAYDAMNERILALCAEAAHGLAAGKLRDAADLLRDIRGRLPLAER